MDTQKIEDTLTMILIAIGILIGIEFAKLLLL